MLLAYRLRNTPYSDPMQVDNRRSQAPEVLNSRITSVLLAYGNGVSVCYWPTRYDKLLDLPSILVLSAAPTAAKPATSRSFTRHRAACSHIRTHYRPNTSGYRRVISPSNPNSLCYWPTDSLIPTASETRKPEAPRRCATGLHKTQPPVTISADLIYPHIPHGPIRGQGW